MNFNNSILLALLLSLVLVGCTKTDDKLTITTKPIAEITSNGAKSGGNVVVSGNIAVEVCGICWSENPSPIINDFFTTDNQGAGEYISTMKNLKSGTQYFVRAYATTVSGIMYGEEKYFVTLSEGGGGNNGGGNGGGSGGGGNGTVSVTTNEASGITTSSAVCGGNVTVSGEVTIMAKGLCYAIYHNPTIENFHTTMGQGTGSFISNLDGLSASTIYYVRAYATNNSGVTTYGNEISFTTQTGGGDASFSVSTHGVTEITATTAQCGGVVTCNGDFAVTARGVCWSTSPNPTIAQAYTTDGHGAGSFISTLTGLSANTKYFVKAYAQSTTETVYGAEMNFTTANEEPAPSVTVTLINVTPTYLELKFEPSSNTSYYCYNIGGTLTSTTHVTGVTTKKFSTLQGQYLQPDREYEFSVVAYDANGTAGDIIHPKYKTNPAPYSNYYRVMDSFYQLYYAKLLNEPTANAYIRRKEIQLWSTNGYYIRYYVLVNYYETDNNWSPGVYRPGGSGVGASNCEVWRNGNVVGGCDTFTISKSGNTYTYDLYGDYGSITAHFTGVPTY